MKRKLLAFICACSLLALTACGGNSSSDTNNDSSSNSGTKSSSDSDLIETGNQPIDNAVYTNQYVSLAPYTGLEVEKKVYEVSQEDIDESIEETLTDYATYNTVDRASKKGDWVFIAYTAQVDGETADESDDEEYYIVLGDAELGEDVDQKLTGVKAGDTLSFTVTYSEDEDIVGLAGQTVDYNITVNKIQEEILPECTDEFVKENLDYDSYDDFEAATKESLAETYEEESMDDLEETLIQLLIDNSSILAYKQEDYDEANNAVIGEYQGYAEMFGTDLETIYETFEVTDDYLEESTIHVLYQDLILNAIIENEKLELTDEEYEEGLENYVEINGYESTDELLEDFSEEYVRNLLLQEKATDFVVDNANITEVPTVYE